MRILYYAIFLGIIFSNILLPQSTTWVKINPDSSYDVAAIGDSLLFVTTYNNGLELSSDNGSNWIKKNLSPTSNPLTKLSVNNSSGSIFVFSVGDHKIYKSTNEGDLWDTSLSVNGSIVDLISKKGNLYAISDSGDFYLSIDNGDTWDSSFVSKGLTCIDVCSTGQIFIGTNKIEIYSSIDAGKSWNSLIIDIAYDIAIDNNDNILACTYDGFNNSKDFGQSWDKLIAPGYTVPLNYSSESKISVDNNNNWYLNGAYILRSTNNGYTWGCLGGVFANKKVKILGNNIYVASPNGLFKYDFSTPIYIGSNYFPLKLGNKWQFIYDNYSYSIGPTYHLIQQIEVVNDTLIKGHKYFKIKSINGNTYFGYDNRWIRYSEDDKKIYTWSYDSEAVYIDFNLSVNSTFFHVSNFLNATNQNKITEGSKNLFNNSFKYKGYLTGWAAMEEHEQEFGENIGPISFSDFGPPIGPGKHYANSTLINAIIYDSTNTPVYYSNHNKPEINLIPVNKINTDTLKLNFSVIPEYLRFTNMNFIDTVFMLSFYSKDNLKIINDTMYAINVLKTENYILSAVVDTSLLKNGFVLNYKIGAKDKSLIPEFSSSPDSGYYQCIWDNSTSVNDEKNYNLSYKLEQNYPNPFNPSTTVYYEIPNAGLVTIKVYDLLGREIETLVNEEKNPGTYKEEFNGSMLASGLYFYRITANKYTATRKMLLMK